MRRGWLLAKESSVTGLCKILPLSRNWSLLHVYEGFFGKIWTILQLNIWQILNVVNGQMLKKWSSNLVTLYDTSFEAVSRKMNDIADYDLIQHQA